ncbi:MAG: hypothetical protein IPL83_11630 [Bdellovibrionales bacterium]|nr:hypothetical protein [Bdellovibrionales bacterium]
MCPRYRELAELNLRNSGSSSAWCSAHKGAPGPMFEDPEFLRFSSARTLSLGQQSKQASLRESNTSPVSLTTNNA